MNHQLSASGVAFLITGMALISFSSSCARLPYTTKVMHQDGRVIVALQQEVEQHGYSHPAHLDAAELTSILEGFSFRPKKRMPLRWFAEEDAPKPVFRPDELAALTGPLAEALRAAAPGERVHFQLRAPGFNPAAGYDVVGGWMAVREPYLYLTLEYVHVQVPNHKFDPYDYNYPTPMQLPSDYLLYFDPGRFLVTDPQGNRALDYREFLRAPKVGPASGR